MAKNPQDAALGFVEELFKTPNGQIRLVGAIMCIGPGYYLMNSGAGANNFVYVMMSIGTMFILISAGMAIWAQLEADKFRSQRKTVRDTFEPSPRLREFTSTILKIPQTRKEIAMMRFPPYNDMKKDALHSLLMQSTANECIMCGLVSRKDGQYVAKQTDQTVMYIP